MVFPVGGQVSSAEKRRVVTIETNLLSEEMDQSERILLTLVIIKIKLADMVLSTL